VGKHILENWQCGKEKIRGTARQITPKHRGGKAVFFAISSALGTRSDRSVRRILHDDLHFHPYKLAVVQELTERDFAARQHACEAFLETLPDDVLVFFSDEAHFHLSGCVNKQNVHYWSDNNP
jgi:hypothetical protein